MISHRLVRNKTLFNKMKKTKFLNIKIFLTQNNEINFESKALSNYIYY